MAQDKYVYFFGSDQTDGSAEMRSLLGGKGANLARIKIRNERAHGLCCNQRLSSKPV